MAEKQGLVQLAIDRWPIVSVAVAAIFLPFLLQRLSRFIYTSSIPLVGKEFGNEKKRRQAYVSQAQKIYIDGYKKFKDGVFRMTTPRTSTVVVVSPKFLDELKKLPDDVLSFEGAVKEVVEARILKVAVSTPIVPHVLKTHLNPRLFRLNTTIAEEVEEAVRIEMPSCKDWKEVNINHCLTRIVTRAAGRIFIGPKVCRTEEYIDSQINWAKALTEASGAIMRWPRWLRYFLGSSLPQVKMLAKRREQVDVFMRPIVEARRKLAADPSSEQPEDMLQWIINSQDKFPDPNSQDITEATLAVTFGSMHTTVLTATNALLNLAIMPEFVEELREELRQVLAENNGEFTSNTLQSLEKMDSLLKESLRTHPSTIAIFQRKVMKSITLFNGQYLPAGVTIETPVHAVGADPELFPDPDKFDPLRFYKLREKARGAGDSGTTNQFVSVNKDYLVFGYGPRVCPGRFFAANEIKIILSKILMKYDVKNADGSLVRYPNIEFTSLCMPDPSKNLLFKDIV